jgi:hypothetical protein
MTIDLNNDQQIAQEDNSENLVLDKFTTDIKAQIIEELAEGLMSRMFEDERLKAFTSLENMEAKKGERSSNPIQEKIQKVQKNMNSCIHLEDLVPKNNKLLNTVLKKHENAKNYLQIVHLLYEEVSVEHRDFPCTKHECLLGGADETIEMLMRLESFMLLLRFKPTPAFIYYGSTGRYVRKESPANLEQRITSLGREFLFIWSKQETIRSLDHSFLTNNIKTLSDFFKNLYSNFRNKTTFTLKSDLTLDSLSDLNNYLLALKEFMDSGQLEKRLAVGETTRVRDGDEEPERFFVRPNRIEFNVLWKTKTIKWKEAIEYFTSRFKDKGKSVLLCRAEIRLCSRRDRVTAKEFQDFFGAFNKKANTPKGLIGYSDFLYFWKEDFSNKELVLDLVSIFEADTLLKQDERESEIVYSVRNIREELEEYLRNIHLDHKEKFTDDQVKLKFTPIPILLNPSYDFAPEFLIESGETKKWNIFENKIIPYFVYMETFDLPYSDDIPKRFTRAQKKVS